jgi:hypothetical protein
VHKQVKVWRALAARDGWTFKDSGGGHERWYSPDGKAIVTVSRGGHSYSNWQRLTWLKRDLRNAGLKMEA